jgi:hypothetical protein
VKRKKEKKRENRRNGPKIEQRRDLGVFLENRKGQSQSGLLTSPLTQAQFIQRSAMDTQSSPSPN